MNIKSLLSNYINNSSLLFNKLYFYESVDSTNVKCAEIKYNKNFIVFADKQTSGKGRYNRTWESPQHDNLYFSFLIHVPLLDYNELCILVSYAVFEILEKYNPDIYIKWPNDIMHDNKKICGILIEREFKGNRLDFAVIGIGINLFTDFLKIPDLKEIAVSLGQISDEKIEKEIILIEFLKLFEKYYLHFPEFKNEIVRNWISRISDKNKIINFRLKDNIIKGRLKKVNRDGSIVIEAGGKENIFHFGEII